MCVIYRKNPDSSIEVFLDIVSLEDEKTFEKNLFMTNVTQAVTEALLKNIPVVNNYVVIHPAQFGKDFGDVIYFHYFL